MNAEQRAFLAVVIRWLEIRQRFGSIKPETAENLIRQLPTDADHSALLRRLLDGKEPLPEPPPRACSYPWYSIVEDGSAEAVMAEGVEQDHYDGRCMMAGLGDHVHVNQSPWLVMERRSPTEMLVRWKPDSPRYRLWRDVERFKVASPARAGWEMPAAWGWYLERETGR